ncbi:MAG: ABC transporter ATP-binding protein [Gemmatimonadota bacterium]
MIQLSEVAKYYGDKRALGPVSFEIPVGSTVGFLGLNGVGKTTLLRILACDLRPSAGVARVDGVDVLDDPHAVRRKVGYLPEDPPLYRDMTVAGYLEFAGRIKGLDPSEVTARIPAVEEATHLTHMHHELIRHLSHGYRQRVGVAQALVHDPEVLILDEPTNGLDPVQIREMRDLIRGLRGSHTILISSHILPEISETCDEILILNDGEIVASGTEGDLSERVLRSTGTTVEVKLPDDGAGVDPAESMLGLLRQIPHASGASLADRGRATLTFRVDGKGDLRAMVCRTLVEAGHEVVRLDRAHRELEGIFVELVGGAQ